MAVRVDLNVSLDGFATPIAASSALSTYLDTLLFRYASGLPVPGISPEAFPPLRS